MNPDPKAYRLPTNVFPERYDIKIDARLTSEDFHGKVTIQLDVKEIHDTIELHSRDLTLSDAIIRVGGNMRAGVISLDNEREMAAIRFDEPLPTGPATLELSFAGKVSKNMEGLYRAKDGHEECLCTQCEETDARGIFPCFDEPIFKAQFAWEVTTSPDVVVLANGPLVSTKESADGKSKTWTFAPTKLMSSYLVALVIGDMAGTPQEVVEGVPISVVALSGKESMGQFAHEYTKRLLPWFNEYFGVPYHFDKYDQVGVPGFAAGAMENSGLVLFRQSRLLMNKETASWDEEKSIAKVVAHEFAHMWFGNLVTMRWWDDLWLNEAFAEWMAHKAVNALDPDYKVWNDFVASKSRGKVQAMDADALESTHSIYSPVETPAQATELFDVITYEKGCAVMRMIESFIGEDAFRNGLRTYMKEFSESNATGSDLWRHLQQASDQSVTAIMESWITQPGYPVVTVSVKEGNTMHLSQTRFYSKPDVQGAEGQVWQAPMIIHYADDTGTQEIRYVLTERDATLQLKVQGRLRWLYANAEEIGFYRQDLDGALLDALLSNLDKLSPLEQVGLFSDQWALVRSGAQSISKFLDVASAMAKLDNYSLLDRMVNTLGALERMLEEADDEIALDGFRRWLDRSFGERLSQLGFEPRPGESNDDAQSRAALVDIVASSAHNKIAIEQATRYADREAANPESVDANLASSFVSIAAQFGDPARFDRYVEVYKRRKASSSSPQETERYLFSFAKFRQPELVTRTLRLMDEGTIPQEAIGVVLTGQMLPHLYSQEQAWKYVKQNWSRFHEILGEMWLGRLIESSSNLRASKRDEMLAFYRENLHGIGEKSLARSIERMDLRIEFLARTKDDLLAWFRVQ